MRRLQEGSDVGDDTVASPRWTRLSPKEENVGEYDAPNRESGAHGRRRRRGSRPRSPQHQRQAKSYRRRRPPYHMRHTGTCQSRTRPPMALTHTATESRCRRAPYHLALSWPLADATPHKRVTSNTATPTPERRATTIAASHSRTPRPQMTNVVGPGTCRCCRHHPHRTCAPLSRAPPPALRPPDLDGRPQNWRPCIRRILRVDHNREHHPGSSPRPPPEHHGPVGRRRLSPPPQQQSRT
jgi:hypothetical protein